MSQDLISLLRAALDGSPHNAKLLVGLLEAVAAQAPPEQRASMERSALDAARVEAVESEADQRTLARALLRHQRAEQALLILSGQTPENLVVRARCLLALDRVEEAKRLYDTAVASNATVQDTELERLLETPVARSVPAGQPKLRVIANDDTARSEVVRLFATPVERITFADVGGLDQVKQQIQRKIVLPFQKPSIFARFKKKVGGGILMYGPPGCGKTLMARATAGECGAEFFNVAISDILDMYIGESERKLHAIFDKVRSKTPAVLFFDELEALAGKRQYSREGTSSKLVSQFLAEMDGFAHNNQGVLVLGATNVPWAVDPAFRRAGRFDRTLFIPPPDAAARQQILEGMMRERPQDRGVDLALVAKRSSGYSGADLLNIVETAADEAIERSLASGTESVIMQADLLSALSEVKSTTQEWLSTARNYARYANEAGQYDDVLTFLKQHTKE
ncbi:MAG TPA: ATP-binding protein [Polyangiaceae bacterium]|nr:ATP-binding protein [Polyangiaceae bacterium]